MGKVKRKGLDMEINKNHYIRQTDLIDPIKLTMPIAIIGAGSTGSFTSLALLKMGCQDITVYDHDLVEEHNLNSQLYSDTDISKPKVEALKDKLFFLSPIEPKIVQKRWTPEISLKGYEIVIAAVDTMQVRKDLFESDMKLYVPHYIDGRMGGNVINLYYTFLPDPASYQFYKDSLFTDEEASPVECSSRAVSYNSFMISSLIASMVAQIANEEKPKKETTVDLKNFMMN